MAKPEAGDHSDNMAASEGRGDWWQRRPWWLVPVAAGLAAVLGLFAARLLQSARNQPEETTAPRAP